MRKTDSTPTNGQDHAEVFRGLAGAVQEYLHVEALDRDEVAKIADERIDSRMPMRIEVALDGGKVTPIDGAHCQLQELLDLVNEGHHNLLMVGSTGSGKTTLAHGLAKALDLSFGFISLSAGITESHLLGRTLPDADGAWRFKAGKFVDIYENGGVFLLDEIDAADANVMVAINAALANGHLVTTDGVAHVRHDRAFIIGAANTWGRGGDHQYVGRNALDAATMDRFVLCTIHVRYDESLEARLLGLELPKQTKSTTKTQAATPAEVRDWVYALRASITSNRLRRIASTRLIVNAMMAAKAGRSLVQIQSRYFQDWSADEKAKVGHAE